MQKKQYVKPELNTYGSIEQLTQASGSTPVADQVIQNGVALSIPTDGSGDIVVP